MRACSAFPTLPPAATSPAMSAPGSAVPSCCAVRPAAPARARRQALLDPHHARAADDRATAGRRQHNRRQGLHQPGGAGGAPQGPGGQALCRRRGCDRDRVNGGAMDRLEQTETPEKDAPLRYDIRLLGRILGDTVRAQEGEEVFDLVEHIRRSGVQFHRDADEGARQELQSIRSRLPIDRALRIIRAFGYFSHLANLAEDQHHIRRTRAYAMAEAPARAGTMAWALGRAHAAGISAQQLKTFFDAAFVCPFLTA